MVNTISGNAMGTNMKIGIVVGRFNEMITKQLLHGAIGALKSHGVKEEDITVTWVPGAFEIPLAAQEMAKQEYDAILTLGLVIRGATAHFDYVCNEAAKGVSSVALQAEKPVIFGILTTDTIEQAIERAGTTGGNKGADTAVAAIEMVNALSSIRKGQSL